MSTATTTTTPRAPAHAEGVSDPEIPAKARRRRFDAAYKLAILDEYDRLSEPGAKGALLRREGLYSSQIVEWRRSRDVGALAELGRPRGRKPRRTAQSVELKRMQRRAERAEAELAKARLVIELDRLYEQLDLVELDAELAGEAGALAETHDLRGYDAVHPAAAHRVADADLVFVAGDRPLLAAASGEQKC